MTSMGSLYKWMCGVCAAIIIALVGIGWAQTDERIKKKADKETIMAVVQAMKEQRKEDQTSLIQQRIYQQKTNDQMFILMKKIVEQTK